MSRSCWARARSLRSWATSSSDDFSRPLPGNASAPSDSTWPRQVWSRLRSMPRLAATSVTVRPGSRLSRTASRLNSGLYFRRDFDMDTSLPGASLLLVWVSTFPAEDHSFHGRLTRHAPTQTQWGLGAYTRIWMRPGPVRTSTAVRLGARPPFMEPSTMQSNDTLPSKVFELDLQGMTCASCVRRIDKALRAVPGVAAAE